MTLALGILLVGCATKKVTMPDWPTVSSQCAKLLEWRFFVNECKQYERYSDV